MRTSWLGGAWQRIPNQANGYSWKKRCLEASGIDARDGFVATEGWAETSTVSALDLALRFEDAGAAAVICTDIGRDGMLQGINIEATVKLAQAVGIPVIASGGLSNLTDIENLCEVEEHGVEGVICGRAIYSGDLDFAAAQKRADELNGELDNA